MYVIVVTLQAKPEGREAFLEAALEDGRGSTRDEPGCLRFDVYNDQSDPKKFVFVEVYKDEAAFQTHTKMPHFAAWREATKDLMAGTPTAVRCTNVFPSDADWK